MATDRFAAIKIAVRLGQNEKAHRLIDDFISENPEELEGYALKCHICLADRSQDSNHECLNQADLAEITCSKITKGICLSACEAAERLGRLDLALM